MKPSTVIKLARPEITGAFGPVRVGDHSVSECWPYGSMAIAAISLISSSRDIAHGSWTRGSQYRMGIKHVDDAGEEVEKGSKCRRFYAVVERTHVAILL